MHEHFCIFNDLISSDQFRDHTFDFVHKLCIMECSLLNILENTKFVAGELSLRLSLMLYLPIWIYEL